MATVQALITSARYDLRDYGKGLVFDNAELLDYLNRMIGIMDSQLAALDSDLSEAEDTSLTTTEDQNYVDISSLNDGNWDSIRRLFLKKTVSSTDYYELLEQISVNDMRYKRTQYSSTSQQPNFWALSGTNILFECPANQYDSDGDGTNDTDYTLAIYYDKKSSVLSLTDSMPYNSCFDQLFREMLVSHAKAKKEGRILRTDSYYQEIFRKRAMEENLRRNFIKKPYSKDF